MSATALERQVGSTVAGKYRLIRVIGRGGMGVVYEAEHAMTRRRVAVKVLHAHHKESGDAAKRFINEAQAAGRLSHPNVVEVLDAGEDTDGSLYLVLELLTGHDLATHLMRVRRMEVADVVTVMAQVLQALVAAHKHQIIHRDIKPENIYLTRSVTGDRHVKILDFGISKAIGSSDAAALSVTQTNTTVGTPHYMSPEQARGERTIDTRADLWAVGVVMYECLAGRVPFDGDTYNDQIVKVITEPHVPLSNFDVPTELSHIVDKSLAKDRNKRYAKASDMLADIRVFISRHPEYSSVPMHLLREPTHVQGPPTMPPRPGSLTVQTAADPSFADTYVEARPSDTNPELPGAGAGGLASLYETGAEDAPTKIRSSLNDPGPKPGAGPHGMFPGGLPPSPYGPPIVAPLPSPQSGVAPVTVPASRRKDGNTRTIVLVAGLLGAAAVIGGVAAVLSVRGSRANVAAAQAGAGSMVTLRFTGVPQGALVVVGGVPFYSDTAVIPRGAAQTPVQITAPGYQPVQFSVVPDRDQTLPLAMQPALNVAPQTQQPQTQQPQVPQPRFQQPQMQQPQIQQPQPMQPQQGRPEPAVQPGQNVDPPARPAARPQGRVAAPAQPRAPTMGFVTVTAQPPCTILVDDQIRGRSPVTRVAVTPGNHRVICRTATGALRMRPVTVTAGRETVVNFAP